MGFQCDAPPCFPSDKPLAVPTPDVRLNDENTGPYLSARYDVAEHQL